MTQQIDGNSSYSIKQVGFYLGLSDSWVRRLIKDGRINATKPTGGQFRITGAEPSVSPVRRAIPPSTEGAGLPILSSLSSHPKSGRHEPFEQVCVCPRLRSWSLA